MQYYGTRLSENLSKREPEGYLLCLNVPVARTGTQEYLPEELGIACGRGDPSHAFRMTGESGLIPVMRPEEEVFSRETIASFEGMPVTNGHPPEGVDVSNIRALQKGHAHNVRRGSGEESDLLLADLIITDPDLIEQILGGKREISCGYTYELCEENGQYIQRQIRGNHVAVVDAGRAGSRVCIKDQKPKERRKGKMKKSLSKVLARMAKDGDIETVAGIIEEMIESEEKEEEERENAACGRGDPSLTFRMTTEEEPETKEDPAVVVETAEENTVAVDGEILNGILERLDRIIALLEPSAADESAVEQITEAIEALAEETEENSELSAEAEIACGRGDPSTSPSAPLRMTEREAFEMTLEDPDEPEDASVVIETSGGNTVAVDGDVLRTAIAALRPVLARLPRKEQRRVADEIADRLRRASGRRAEDADIYQALASAGRRTAPASAELGRRIMEKRNISCRRENSRGGK